MFSKDFNETLSPAIISFIVVLIACAVHLPLHLNHDAAWHFQTAFRFLAGDEIGIDVFDINPPMSMWIFSLPAALVNMTGWSPKVVFKLFFMAVALIAILGSAKMLKWSHLNNTQINIITALLCLTAFVLPGYDFAQREQFTALLTLPYVIAVILRATDKPFPLATKITVGIIAAVGIGIKPYFLCLPILMEIWLMLQRKNIFASFRIETVSMVLTFLIYLGAIFVFAPGYYIYVLPDALNNYGGFGASITEALKLSVTALFPYIAIVTIIIYIFKNTIREKIFQGILMAAMAFFLSALLQKKGWGYQLYPAVFYVIIASATQLVRSDLTSRITFSTMNLKQVRFGLTCVLSLMIITPAFQFLADGYSPRGTTARVDRLSDVIKSQAQLNKTNAPSVFAFITSPRDIHPAVLNSRARWAHNTGAIVYLPAAVNAAAKDPKPDNYNAITETAKRHDRAMIDRFAKAPPDIIFVNSSPYKLGISDPDFDYLSYYREDAVFETVFSKYTELDPIMQYRVFTISR